MKKKIVLILVYCTIQLMAAPLLAQNQPGIKSVFDEYQRKKGSVLVHLSSDILSQGSNLSLYKSLIISNIQPDEKAKILATLLQQKGQWTTQQEVIKNGSISSATYLLKHDKKYSEYLLLKTQKDKLTIVYIQGRFEPSHLDRELKKLKDLIIYVNNKKIKLN